MDARGTAESELLEGVHRSSMEELAAWTTEADAAAARDGVVIGVVA